MPTRRGVLMVAVLPSPSRNDAKPIPPPVLRLLCPGNAVLAAAEASAKPVVVIFLGADPAQVTRKGVYGAAYLAQAADMAVALATIRVTLLTPTV